MSKRTLGVVIARFQAPSLTPAHRYMLEQVATRVGRVLVLLGVAPIPFTKRNPLEYSLRARMVMDWWEKQFPDRELDLQVAPLLDRPTDSEWVAAIDQTISAMNINGPAMIFCGPDGAGPFYAAAGGRWPVEVLDAAGGHASKVREEMGPQYTEGFRAGIVYAVERRLIGPCDVIDAIVFNTGRKEVLLGKKAEDGTLWRFIGGFVDLVDGSLEHAVQREVREETGLEIGPAQYVGSCHVEDWRFRGGPERILTKLFAVERVFGSAKARDDIDELRWFEVGKVAEALHPIHRPLWTMWEKGTR